MIRAAIDRAHVQPRRRIDGRREIAFFPPMTGGLALAGAGRARLPRMTVPHHHPPAARAVRRRRGSGRSSTRGRTDVGALVTFTGICRGSEDGEPIAALTLEHYPGMAEAEIARHVEEAARAGRLLGVTVIHRYGRIVPGEDIVLVVDGVVASRGGFRGGRIPDGLPEDPRAVLETGRERRAARAGSRPRPPTTRRPGAGGPGARIERRNERARMRAPEGEHDSGA